MVFKIKKVFLLISLILLQSCSGGRIGNFLESSFKNIEEPKIKTDNKNNLTRKTFINSEENYERKKNIEEPKIKTDNKNNLTRKTFLNSEENYERKKNIEEPKIKTDNKSNVKNKIVIKTEVKSKNNRKIANQNILSQKRQYQPESYKIIFILKDVDPKDPTKDLRTILRNSDVNFEIEKIERFFDPKNKSIKTN